MEAEMAMVKEAKAAAEAEGISLHLSNKNATGYAGVWKTRHHNFRASAYDPQSQKMVSIHGSFSTAVGAAIAYARYCKAVGRSKPATAGAEGGATEEEDPAPEGARIEVWCES